MYIRNAPLFTSFKSSRKNLRYYQNWYSKYESPEIIPVNLLTLIQLNGISDRFFLKYLHAYLKDLDENLTDDSHKSLCETYSSFNHQIISSLAYQEDAKTIELVENLELLFTKYDDFKEFYAAFQSFIGELNRTPAYPSPFYELPELENESLQSITSKFEKHLKNHSEYKKLADKEDSNNIYIYLSTLFANKVDSLILKDFVPELVDLAQQNLIEYNCIPHAFRSYKAIEDLFDNHGLNQFTPNFLPTYHVDEKQSYQLTFMEESEAYLRQFLNIYSFRKSWDECSFKGYKLYSMNMEELKSLRAYIYNNNPVVNFVDKYGNLKQLCSHTLSFYPHEKREDNIVFLSKCGGSLINVYTEAGFKLFEDKGMQLGKDYEAIIKTDHSTYYEGVFFGAETRCEVDVANHTFTEKPKRFKYVQISFENTDEYFYVQHQETATANKITDEINICAKTIQTSQAQTNHNELQKHLKESLISTKNFKVCDVKTVHISYPIDTSQGFIRDKEHKEYDNYKGIVEIIFSDENNKLHFLMNIATTSLTEIEKTIQQTKQKGFNSIISIQRKYNHFISLIDADKHRVLDLLQYTYSATNVLSRKMH